MISNMPSIKSELARVRTENNDHAILCTYPGCDLKSKIFPSRSALSRHMRVHTGEKPHRCSTCGKGFSQVGNLTKHMKTHDLSHLRWNRSTKSKPFKCPFDGCVKSFTAKSSLQSHLLSHRGASNTCKYSEVEMNPGIDVTSSGSGKTSYCMHTGCNKVFDSEDELRQHLYSYSPGIMQEFAFLRESVLEFCNLLLDWDNKTGREKVFYRKRAQGVISLAENIPVPFAALNQPQPLLCPLSLVSVPTAAVHGGHERLVDLQNGQQTEEEAQLLRHPNLAATTEYDADYAAESLYSDEDLLQWLAAGGGDGGQEEEEGEFFGAAGPTESAACLAQCCSAGPGDLTCSNCYGNDSQLQLLQSQYGGYPVYPPSLSVAAQPQSQYPVMGELAGMSPRPLSAFSESIAAGWKQHVINSSSSSALDMYTASAYCVPFTVLDQNDGDCCSGDEVLGMGMGMGSFDGSSYSQGGQGSAALSLSLPIAVADATITVRSAPSHMSYGPLDKRDSDSDDNLGDGDDTETDRDRDDRLMRLIQAPVALKRIRSIDSQSSQGDGNQHSQLRPSGDRKGQRSHKPPLKERCMEYRHMQT